MTYKTDQRHENAHAASRELSTGGPYRVITSEMVFTEFFVYASGKGREARGMAVAVLRDTRRDPNVTIHIQTGDLFESALLKYKQANDKKWSLTDCASFVLMEEYGITEAFANDKHFAQDGFKTLF